MFSNLNSLRSELRLSDLESSPSNRTDLMREIEFYDTDMESFFQKEHNRERHYLLSAKLELEKTEAEHLEEMRILQGKLSALKAELSNRQTQKCHQSFPKVHFERTEPQTKVPSDEDLRQKKNENESLMKSLKDQMAIEKEQYLAKRMKIEAITEELDAEIELMENVKAEKAEQNLKLRKCYRKVKAEFESVRMRYEEMQEELKRIQTNHRIMKRDLDELLN